MSTSDGSRKMTSRCTKHAARNAIGCGLAVLAGLVAGPAAAAVWNVPADFASIQDAIDSPLVGDGDTIEVDPGTYSNPPGTGFGPQSYTMNIDKELTIDGSGNSSNPAVGTVFAPFSAGGQATNGAIFITADNVTFRDIFIDGQRNLDGPTGQEVARGFQTSGTNVRIENVTVQGTTHSCFEMNNTVDSAVVNSTCDTTVLGFNGGVNTSPVRVVDSDRLLVENVAVVGPAPTAISYHVVSFQGNNSYTLRDITLDGQTNATTAAQWIFARPVGYCCDPGTQQVTYEGTVVIADAPVGILLNDADPTPFSPADFATTLTAARGVVQFSNVETPLLRTGLGQWDDAEAFLCNVGIPHRWTNGTEERYYETSADALAAQATLGGTVDEIFCPPEGPLVVGPSSVAAGAEVKVSWFGIIPASGSDWIGLFRQSDPATAFRGWFYTSCDQVGGPPRSTGSCDFTIPAGQTAGDYEFRLYGANGFTDLLATSNPLTVSATAGTTLNVAPDTIEPSQTATLSWSGVVSPTATDWIGVYLQASPNHVFLDWLYTSSCSKSPGAPRATGSCPLTLPPSTRAGTYEARLLPNNGFVSIATSNPFAVTAGGGSLIVQVSPETIARGNPVNVSWSGIASPTPRDWIGIFLQGSSNTSYVDWFYTSCTQGPGSGPPFGVCSWAVPTTLPAGTYEARLFGNDSFAHLATDVFQVTTIGGPTVSVSPSSSTAGGMVDVAWDNVDSPTGTDWLGLYEEAAVGNASNLIDWFYTSCTRIAGAAQASGTCSTTLPATLPSGTYAWRLYRNNGYTELVAPSNPLSIP